MINVKGFGIARHTGMARMVKRYGLAAFALAMAMAVTAGALAMAMGAAAGARVLGPSAARALDGYDLRTDEARHIELQNRLREISGLAFDARGGLRAHDDERATVFRIDIATGRIDSSFDIGRNAARGDFEGIAVAGSRIFLVTSNGHVIEAPEGADGTTVDFTDVETPSRAVCDEIEGLEYDAPGNALLLACKAPRTRELRDRLVVLRFSLRSRTLDADPFIATPLEALEAFGIDDELSPSGIAVHPLTGTILIIAARERVIVEVDRSGRVLGAAELRGRYHDQAEGIAIAPDGTLIIADEGGSGDATLTFYPYRPGGGR